MLYRKIGNKIEEVLMSSQKKMLIVDGARQIGKSFIIRHIGKKLFNNYIEINMEIDRQKDRLFADAKTTDSFYMALSSVAGDKLKQRNNTLVFIDEIQAYPHLLTLAKFLVEEDRFTYIASGSLLGVTLRKTQSLPLGSIVREHMYPLDFEEFILANGVGEEVIAMMRCNFMANESLPESLHNKMMDLFRKYLLVGGLPDVVNSYLNEHNVVVFRKLQTEINAMYGEDAAKYEEESSRVLKIQRIYQMVPSNLENKKKRVVVKDIEDKKGKRMSDYTDEFDYLISSGITLEVKAISQPTYPLVQSSEKNLLKLYMNDVGVYTNILYKNNINPVMSNEESVNLGAVYESVVAQELRAHGYDLYYYDNKKNGEVDFLIDDYEHTSVLPIEVKSGKDYRKHSSLNRFLECKDYNIRRAYVLCNERTVVTKGNITYIPVYYVMFFNALGNEEKIFL